MTELEPKQVGETRSYSVNFADVLPLAVTISTQAVTATVLSGTDASPSSIISGSASASGATVTQKITAGTVGVIYTLLWTITTSDSQTLLKSRRLAVVAANP